MNDAAKRKSSLTARLTALRLLLLLVVACCGLQTRVWGFAATPQLAPSEVAFATPSFIEENYDGALYDASDSLVAAKTAPGTFEIFDGVRRAKAAELVGNPTLPAQILNAEGKVVGAQNVPVNQLLSPKSSIDVSTSVNMDRFMNTLNQTKAGSVPPAITVTPGTRGVPIPNVPLDPLGQH